MTLLELFNRTAAWEWLSAHNNPFPGMFQYAAEFHIGDIRYVAGLGQEIDVIPGFDTHMVGFAADIDGQWREDEVGSGNEFLVFSTIMDIIEKYLTKKKPQILLVAGDPHREEIYTRLLKRRKNDLDRVGYVLYGRMEYGSQFILLLVRKDKLEDAQQIDLE